MLKVCFSYDAQCNRIGKIVEFNSGLKNYIWYVRGAQGNVMAAYEANGIADYYHADVASA